MLPSGSRLWGGGLFDGNSSTLRSRRAASAFLLSILGAAISFAYQFAADDKPASMAGGAAVAMPVMIMILIVAQWYYASRQAAAGVLR